MNNKNIIYEWKKKDISFSSTFNYNGFFLQKKNNKTDIQIIINTRENYFFFIDNKKDLSLNLKYENVKTLKNCLKQILGSEEIATVLFNTHFVLSAKEDWCCKTLKELVIDLNWDDPILHEYNVANLICGIENSVFYDQNPCRYNINNSVDMIASRRGVSPHIIYTQKSDMEDTKRHVSFAKGFQKIKKHIQIENEYGYLNLKKASKVANALYWTNLVTGQDFESLADKLGGYKVDELPYNNMYERIKNDNPIMSEVMEKIREKISKNYYSNPFGDFSRTAVPKDDRTDFVKLNRLREGNLHWLIAHTIYTGEAPDDAGAILVSRQQEKWIETRKALLILHIAKRDTWSIIQGTFTMFEDNIVNNISYLFASSEAIYDEYQKNKELTPIIDEIFKETNGVNELFRGLKEKIKKIKY